MNSPSAEPAAGAAASPLRRHGLPGAAVVALVAFALFSPFFLRGEVFLAADTLKQYLPWRSYAPPGLSPHNMLITDPVNSTYTAVYNAQLKSGGLALWNPAMFMGVPATGVTAMMGGPGREFPLKMLLHRLFPVTTAFMLLNFIYVLLMGLTMHVYLRVVGAGSRGSIFGAVAFMLNGYLMVWLEFESVAATAALAPLMLLVIERYRGPRRATAAFAGAAVLGCIGLMGMIQYVIYVWLLCLAYLAFVAVRALRAGGAREAFAVLACFGATASGALLIDAVDFLPAQELIAASSRIARTFTFGEFFARLGAVPGRWWVTLVFPDFFGSPRLHFDLIPRLPTQEYMNYNELCLYLGVPTLFALLGAVAAVRRAHTWFFLGLTALTAAMVAGTHAYWPLFRFVPGMERMNPLRLIFVFALVATAAAGLGLGELEKAGARRLRLFLSGCAALAAVVLAFALVADRPWVAQWFGRGISAYGHGGGDQMLARMGQLRGFGSPLIALPLGLTLASAALFAVFAASARWRTAALLALVALLAADLIGFGLRYNTRARPEELYPETPSLSFLRSRPGPFRVATDARGGFLINSLVPFGLEEVGGYSSFYPERAGRLLSFAEYGGGALAGRSFDRWVQLSRTDSPLLDLMNVRYVLTAPGAVPPGSARFREIFRGDIGIWENLEALPRAYVVPNALVRKSVDQALAVLGSPGFDKRTMVVLEENPDPSFLADAARAAGPEGVTIDRYGPDAIGLTASLSTRGWLVLADTWYPGWEAVVDGAPAQILRANANFRALPLRAGRHRVEFVFRPPAVRRGRIVSAIGVLLIAVGLAWAWRRERRAQISHDRGETHEE